jgi:hypothetical protein
VTVHRDNLKWAGRMMLILLLVGSTDCLVIGFASHPLPAAALIPGFIPLFTCVFVIIPMIKAKKAQGPST